MKGRIVVGVVVLLLGGCAMKPGNTARTEGMSAEQAFENIKSLQGDWRGVGSHGESMPSTTRFELTSGGSVVRETMFPGTEMEMVNMYSLDNGSVAMTHYCMMGNQPHLRLKSVEGNVYKFEYVNGGNLVSRDQPHMDSMILTMEGPDHYRSTWTSWADGKPTEDKATFDHERVKDGGHASH